MSETLQAFLAMVMTFGPIVLCFGVPCLGFVLLFMGILVWGSRQYGSLQKVVANAKPISIGEAKAGMGIVRLCGIIRQVAQPLWLSGSPPLAMLRLQITGRKHDGEVGPIQGKIESSPFLLEDGTGGLWVDPRPVDKRLLLPPSHPSQQEIEDACEALKIDHAAILRTSYPQKYELWTWKEGDAVTVIGQAVMVGDRLTISRVKEAPMLVSQMEDQELAQHVKASSGKMRTVTIVMAVVFAFLLLCVAAAIVLGLGRMFIDSL